MGLSQIHRDNRHLLMHGKENAGQNVRKKKTSSKPKICLNDFLDIKVDTKDIKNCPENRKPLKKIKFLNE